MAATTLELIGIVVPLGLDTLGVAVALGVAGLTPAGRLRLALVFAGFEAVMPLIGVAVGTPVGRAIGRGADYAAAGLIAALGIYMLFFEGAAEEGRELGSKAAGGALAVIALGLSISLDELAIGIGAGLLRLPIVPLCLAVGVQAFVATQVGVRVGRRAGGRIAAGAERIAGAALLALGVFLLVEALLA